MKPLAIQPGLGDQVYRTLLDGICDGSIAPGAHLVQEQIAAYLGVSRQPVQQALAVLKNEGLVIELGRRGLFVAPLDVDGMRHHYEIRAALDGLAARRAAQHAAADGTVAAAIKRDGGALIAAGNAAVAKGSVAEMVGCDVDFHAFVYTVSGNPLLSATAEPHWRHLRRVMGDVLRHAEPPHAIWRQHADILAAIVKGDPARAEKLAVAHVTVARQRLEAALVRMAREDAETESPPDEPKLSRSARARSGA